jgi:putative transposase
MQKAPSGGEKQAEEEPEEDVQPDKLASYSAAKRELRPGVEPRRHQGLDNRAENAHQPTRRRERQTKRFKAAGQTQRFLFAHDQVNNLFPLCRDHAGLPTSTEPRGPGPSLG